MPISRRHLYAAILITGLSNALAHAIIPRTSVAYNAAIEPRFTIETSTPPATTTPPTSITDSVFCTVPTSLPEGLCLETVTYNVDNNSTSIYSSPSLTPSSSSTASTSTSLSQTSPSTSIRLYPCNESTTIISSTTYALNCINNNGSYTVCPTSVEISPTPIPTSTTTIQPITRDCFDENGSTVTCAASSTSTATPTSTTHNNANGRIFAGFEAISSSSTNDTISLNTSDSNVISQCFDLEAIPTSCPALCGTPFVTAPGPVLPTQTGLAGLESGSGEDDDGSTSTTSIRVFQTSPAPIIRTIINAPAFLTSGRPSS